MIKKIKYHKLKHQFNLVDNHRHYQTRNTREKEVILIDNWLMETDNELVITFVDGNGKLHENVSIDTTKMCTYFNGDDDFGDWRSFVWDFPTKFGHVFIHALDSRCYLDNKLIPSRSVIVSVK